MKAKLLSLAGGSALVVAALQVGLSRLPSAEQISSAGKRAEQEVRDQASAKGGLTAEQERILRQMRAATQIQQAQLEEYKRQADERLQAYMADQKKLEADAQRAQKEAERILRSKEARKAALKLAEQLRAADMRFSNVDASDVPAEWTRRLPTSLVANPPSNQLGSTGTTVR